jgi:hypothetical protein
VDRLDRLSTAGDEALALSSDKLVGPEVGERMTCDYYLFRQFGRSQQSPSK